MSFQPPTAYDDYVEILGFESGVYLRAGESVPATSTPETAPSTSTSSAASLKLLFVGEELDASSPASAAPSQELLSKMIQAMGLQSHDFQIIEAHADRTLLLEQIKKLNPHSLVVFGNQGAQTLFGEHANVAELRNQFHILPELTQELGREIEVMNTYHPALCLINPSLKKPVWEDLQLVMKALGLKK